MDDEEGFARRCGLATGGVWRLRCCGEGGSGVVFSVMSGRSMVMRRSPLEIAEAIF